MKKPSPKQARTQADKVFSLIIRSKGYCEHCGKTCKPSCRTRAITERKHHPDCEMQCAHWKGRSHMRVRTDPDNAFCLCKGCHMHFTHNPIEWHDWTMGYRGRATYDRLNEAAYDLSGPKVNWFDELVRLEQIWQEIADGMD